MSVILVASLAIAYLVIGIRSLGWLQPMELEAFDHLIQLRPREKPDSRLLLITIDEADIQDQNQQNMSLRWSLADDTTWQFYEKTEQKESKVKNEILKINLSDDSLSRSAEINS
ncbi:MAG: CHASE2 domain-containing protein [Waterburya sp.]